MQSFFSKSSDKAALSLLDDSKSVSEKETIQIFLNYQCTWPENYYRLVMRIQSSEIATNILSHYDLNCDYFRSGLYSLEQIYKAKNNTQLSHLLHFLHRNAYISLEKYNLLLKEINHVLPCSDEELTALFSGYTLLEALKETTAIRIFDAFYDSQEMARIPDPDGDRAFALNQLRYNIIQTCKRLYQNNAHDILKRLLSSIKETAHRFDESNRRRLLPLIPEYQKKLEIIDTTVTVSKSLTRG